MPQTLRLWPFMLLALCLLTSKTRAEDDPCTVRDGDRFYDLSPLKAKKDYVFRSPEGQEYMINVCSPVTTETWAMKVDDPDNVGGFTRGEHGDFSLGYSNTTLTVRDGHPAITMSNGSPCPTHVHMHAATTIQFKCDTSVFGAGEPVLIAQLPPPDSASCYFFFEWKTHVACPTQARGGGWGIIAILATIAGVLFLVYIAAGVLYNYFILDRRGVDVIPRYSLFSLKDTVQFFRRCVERVKDRSSGALHFGNGGGGWGRRDGSYSGLAGSREEEAGMLSGPPGFLDEDDEEDPEEHENNRPQGIDSSGVIRL
ncbi:hypothetical protein PHLCEN_2v2886 [Hermanssonia centrifuga]|uniref:Autophagy-related protein 27 n=1 Tax=Hermanssonia centrifuga TaxID=98765 RepID=A0A2R6RIB0_9APHY|nr:hypothetical protein PHLCEN_2v2886 [Hermanssonia centrifuga]